MIVFGNFEMEVLEIKLEGVLWGFAIFVNFCGNFWFGKREVILKLYGVFFHTKLFLRFLSKIQKC